MTSLESIAEKLNEKRKLELEDILKISGSFAITKNEYGITAVDEKNVASSLLFKKLKKPKLDNAELVKAVDVEVKELKPDIPVAVRDLIPKPLYDEQVKINGDLTKEVEKLNGQINNLNTQIDNLKLDVENERNSRLNIEQSNDALANQVDSLSKTIEDFSIQIQSSLQKSIEESILRASLQAQNTGFKAQIEALIKQIDSLNSIIEGLQSQLGAVQQQQAIQQSTTNLASATGADVINEVAIAKFTPNTTEKGQNALKIVGRIKNSNSENRWESGETLEFTNNDSKPINVTIKITNPSGQNWLSADRLTLTVPDGKSENVKFKLWPGGCSYGNKDNSKSYDGTISISVKRADNSEKSITYRTRINIMHKSSY
jgi:chromosome segregation ATPase